MRIRNMFKLTTVSAAMVLYLFSAVEMENLKIHNVEIDAGLPLAVVWPCEVSVVGDEGEKGLRIAPKIGRGWRGEAGGTANYRFFVPAEGRYTMWVYCLWYDECANAIFAKVDDMEKVILGNDPVYKQWHWVRGISVDLQAGTHTLELSNHSDHIAVQKLFLAGSPLATPDDCEVVFSDIFYDGFDGCDQGNFAQWRQVSGKWQVHNPFDQTCIIENSLVAHSQGHALIVYENKRWTDYAVNVSAQLLEQKSPNATAGICFGLQSEREYYLLKWSGVADENRVIMQVVKQSPDKEEILAQVEHRWDSGKWHGIEIMPGQDSIVIAVDGDIAMRVAVKEQISGGIGLWLSGELSYCWDNVHVRQNRAK